MSENGTKMIIKYTFLQKSSVPTKTTRIQWWALTFLVLAILIARDTVFVFLLGKCKISTVAMERYMTVIDEHNLKFEDWMMSSEHWATLLYPFWPALHIHVYGTLYIESEFDGSHWLHFLSVDHTNTHTLYKSYSEYLAWGLFYLFIVLWDIFSLILHHKPFYGP